MRLARALSQACAMVDIVCAYRGMAGKGACRARDRQGQTSQIVVDHPPGQIVSMPRTLVDYVVTEYGVVAHLTLKTEKQRAAELIAAAHPDFRLELREAARRRYG